MRQFIFSVVTCTALLTSFLTVAQASDQLDEHASAWTLSEQNDQVKVYTRAYKDSNFSAFKAVSRLKQPIGNILAVLSDATSCPLWVENCVHSGNLEVTSFNDRVGFSESNLPWPLKNRDMAVRILTSNPNGRNEIQIAMSTEAGRTTENSETVHVTDSKSLYILRAVTPSETELVWMQHTEPAGNLPSWLVNSMIVNLPLNSIVRLEQTASTEKYQNTEIIYDNQGRISHLGRKIKP